MSVLSCKELIESQQKGKDGTDVFCVGEQLKDIIGDDLPF